MSNADKAAIMKMSDAHLTVADPAEDVRGRTMLDRAGDEIGEVDDLLIDEQEAKVRFLQVASGGFLGIGEQHFLVPVDAITSIDADHVQIDKTREHVAGAPKYQPDLVDDAYYGGIYGYYGYGPYWGPGYVYPGYPYYP